MADFISNLISRHKEATPPIKPNRRSKFEPVINFPQNYQADISHEGNEHPWKENEITPVNKSSVSPSSPVQQAEPSFSIPGSKMNNPETTTGDAAGSVEKEEINTNGSQVHSNTTIGQPDAGKRSENKVIGPFDETETVPSSPLIENHQPGLPDSVSDEAAKKADVSVTGTLQNQASANLSVRSAYEPSYTNSLQNVAAKGNAGSDAIAASLPSPFQVRQVGVNPVTAIENTLVEKKRSGTSTTDATAIQIPVGTSKDILNPPAGSAEKNKSLTGMAEFTSGTESTVIDPANPAKNNMKEVNDVQYSDLPDRKYGLLQNAGAFTQPQNLSQRPHQNEQSSGLPTIKVTIGRVEIKAVIQAPPAVPVKNNPAPKPNMSLEDYLKQRGKKDL